MNLQDVTPPCVSCTVQRRQKQAEASMNEKSGDRLVSLSNAGNFTLEFKPRVWHIGEVVPQNFHISVVWGRVW